MTELCVITWNAIVIYHFHNLTGFVCILYVIVLFIQVLHSYGK